MNKSSDNANPEFDYSISIIGCGLPSRSGSYSPVSVDPNINKMSGISLSFGTWMKGSPPEIESSSYSSYIISGTHFFTKSTYGKSQND